MVRPLLRSVDLLADATFLALAGETLAGATERLGFESTNALVAFLHSHRYDRTARRLAVNTGDAETTARLALARQLLADRGTDERPPTDLP